MTTRADLRNMSSAEVVALHDAGGLDHLLAGREPIAASGADQGARAAGAGEGARHAHGWRGALACMTPAEIVAAHRLGFLDGLLRGEER